MSYWSAPEIKFSEASLDAFNKSMRQYSIGTGKIFKETLIQYSGIAAEEFEKETPPFVDKQASNTLEAKRRGENAVKQSLLRSAIPASEFFNKPFTDKNLERIIRRKKYDDWEKATQYMPRLKNYRAAPFTDELHLKNRGTGKRYDNEKNSRVITLDNSKWKQFLKKLQTRVGYMKAGWAVSVAALGRNVPGWISRHLAYSRGSFKMTMTDDKQEIIMTNGTPTINRFAGRYNYALSWIATKMLKNMEYKLRAEAAKANRK